MADILYDLRSVVSMEGATFSSAEVIGICSRAYTEIERLRAVQPLGDWRLDIENMPKEGSFEALGAQSEVFRHMPDDDWVIIPRNGRMFKPYAWRPAAPQKSLNIHQPIGGA